MHVLYFFWRSGTKYRAVMGNFNYFKTFDFIFAS